MKINKWCEYVHGWAKRKGWWNPIPDSAKVHLNIISEVIEASEEVRNYRPDIYQIQRGLNTGAPIIVTPNDKNRKWQSFEKPEGEAVELADAVIRIMDYFGARGWDLEATMKLKMKYNKSRPYRHGGKKY